MTKRPVSLCRLNEIPDPGSKGVTPETGGGVLELFLVRRGGAVYGSRNRCPHTGAPLDWQPDRFLDVTERFIQCATHGALFRVADGACLQGPCTGQRLTLIPARVREGIVEVSVPAPREGIPGA